MSRDYKRGHMHLLMGIQDVIQINNDDVTRCF